MADRRLLAVVDFITQAPVIRKILNDVLGPEEDGRKGRVPFPTATSE
jgi:hypothetical protein